MGRLEFATPRAAWGGEATDFTPLLGQDDLLYYLGMACRIGRLTLVEVEHPTGSRFLDILAATDDDRKIAIENQYGVGDHDHLTRGLAYAVAVGASGLVVGLLWWCRNLRFRVAGERAALGLTPRWPGAASYVRQPASVRVRPGDGNCRSQHQQCRGTGYQLGVSCRGARRVESVSGFCRV